MVIRKCAVREEKREMDSEKERERERGKKRERLGVREREAMDRGRGEKETTRNGDRRGAEGELQMEEGRSGREVEGDEGEREISL